MRTKVQRGFLTALVICSALIDAVCAGENCAPATLQEASLALGLINGAQLRASGHEGLSAEHFNRGVREGYERELPEIGRSAHEEAFAVFRMQESSQSPAKRDPRAVREASRQAGRLTGARLKQEELRQIDFEHFATGWRRGYEQSPPSPELAAQAMLLKRFKREQRLAGAEERLAQSRAFLAANARRDGVRVTRSGLQYEVLHEGDGPKPTGVDMVTVHMRHSKSSGELVYDTKPQNHAETLALRGAIPEGWREALLLMPLGSRYRVYLPPEIGFGLEGSGDDLLPNELLITEFELIDIIEPPKPVG